MADAAQRDATETLAAPPALEEPASTSRGPLPAQPAAAEAATADALAEVAPVAAEAAPVVTTPPKGFALLSTARGAAWAALAAVQALFLLGAALCGAAVAFARSAPSKAASADSDPFAALDDESVLRILHALMPTERARCAVLSRRFAELLRRPEAWAVVDASVSDDDAAPREPLHDELLLRVAARAGAALRVLNTEGLASRVSCAAVARLLGDAPRLEVLTCFLLLPLHDASRGSFSPLLTHEPDAGRFFTVPELQRLAAACPRLRSAAVGVLADASDGVAALQALAALPRAGVKALVLRLPTRNTSAARAAMAAFAAELGAADANLHALAVVREGQHMLAPRRGREDDEGEYDHDLTDWGARELEDSAFRAEDPSLLAPLVALYVAKALYTNTTLTALDLSSIGVGDRGAKAVAAALQAARRQSGVQELYLVASGLRASGAEALAALLTAPASGLRKLCLDQNLLQERGLEVLTEALSSEACRLRVLSLQCVQHPDAERWSAHMLHYLAGALESNRSLTALNANIVDMPGVPDAVLKDGAVSLAAALGGNTTLTALHLACDDPVTDLLLLALGSNTALHQLALMPSSPMASMMRTNALRRGGSTQLSRSASEEQRLSNYQEGLLAALSLNTSLRELTLRGALPTFIGADCAVLARGLVGHKALTTLELQGCGLDTCGGAAALGAALAARGCALRTLNASHNDKLNHADVAALSRGLAANATLTRLNLGFSGVCPRGAAALADALARNTTLQALNLLGNGVGDDGARALAGALRKNNALAMLIVFLPAALNPAFEQLERARRFMATGRGRRGAGEEAWMPNDIGPAAANELRAAAARRRVLLDRVA
jgi:Ran GTPase-activating protein (RanGAP) involved in mRNA processing and transport